MNQNIFIGGIVVVLVMILALPFVLNAMDGSTPPPASQAKPEATAPPPPPPAAPPQDTTPQPPVVWEGTYAPPPRPIPQYQQPAPRGQQGGRSAGGQQLTAETLVGTAWEVSTPHGAVQIQLGPNGQATASHPLVGNIPGNWRVQGNKVNASASFMGQSMNIDATIQGNNLSVSGQNIRRLR